MVHVRILLALVAGGLASPLLAAPLEAYLRHETPDGAMLAYFLAPVIVAVLSYGAGALFISEPAGGSVVRTNVLLDGRKVGSAVTRHIPADASAENRA
ncbi:hypothetical protein ACLBYG_22315 [Methylobacterium sp. D53M]